MENYDRKYSDYYNAEYESVKTRFSDYKEKFSHHTSEKIGRDFRRMIYDEKDNLIDKEDPIDTEGTSFKVKRNAYKEEVLKKFKTRNEDYRIDPITTFVTEELPTIRNKHIENLRSGKFPLDYQWDVSFIENHTIDDLLYILAKYFALDDFRKELKGEVVTEDYNSDIIKIKASGLKRTSGSKYTILTGEQTGIFHKIFTEEDTRVYLSSSHLSNVSQSTAIGVLSAYYPTTVKKGLEINLNDIPEEDKEALRSILRKALKKLS